MDKLDFVKALNKAKATAEDLSSFKIKEPPEVNSKILKNPELFKIIDNELAKKITGEEKSRKAIFLSLCSIFLEDEEVPLNTLVSSESSAGKSYVCKQIVKIFPPYLVESVSKISPEAFSYWKAKDKNWSWNGSICYLNEISQALLDSATFKVMCSDETRSIIVKDNNAVDLVINGKPCLLITTATTNPSTEVLNRFQIIQLDESEEQTKKICFEQAQAFKKEKYSQDVIDSLSYLERGKVFIPFGVHIHSYLNKKYSWNDIRMRRDFPRLLTLIKCSAILHQFQREKNTAGEVIATEKDYEIARSIINYIQTTTFKGLTHRLRKAYDFCLQEQSFTTKQIHSLHPFCSEKMWYNYLNELCERKLLVTELKLTEESKKRVCFYKVPAVSSFNLPDFEELCINSTIDSIDTIDSNVSNVSNDNK